MNSEVHYRGPFILVLQSTESFFRRLINSLSDVFLNNCPIFGRMKQYFWSTKNLPRQLFYPNLFCWLGIFSRSLSLWSPERSHFNWLNTIICHVNWSRFILYYIIIWLSFVLICTFGHPIFRSTEKLFWSPEKLTCTYTTKLVWTTSIVHIQVCVNTHTCLSDISLIKHLTNRPVNQRWTLVYSTLTLTLKLSLCFFVRLAPSSTWLPTSQAYKHSLPPSFQKVLSWTYLT